MFAKILPLIRPLQARNLISKPSLFDSHQKIKLSTIQAELMLCFIVLNLQTALKAKRRPLINKPRA